MVETARPLVHRLTAGAKGQSVVNLGLHLFSTGMGFVASVLMSRLLGAEGMGVYAFCFAVANVLGVVGRLGLESLLVREVAIARERGNGGLIHGLVNWAQTVSSVISVFATVAIASLGWIWWSDTDPHTARALISSVLLVFGTSAVAIRGAALRGLQHVIAGQLPNMGVRPLLFVVGLVWLTGAGISEPWAVILSHAVACLVAWSVAMALWQRVRPEWQRPVRAPRAWLASALPLMLLAGLNLLTTQVDTLMLKGLSGNAATGIYAVASQLSHVAAIVLTVVGGVMAPRFAALLARGEQRELQRVVARSAAAISLGTLPIAVALLFFGPYVLGLYGEEFGSGYACLAVLLCGQVANAICGNVGQLMVMSGRERELGRVTTCTALLNITLNAAFIPSLGALGAALATTLSLMTWNVLLAARVRTALGIHSTALGSWVAMGDTR